MLFTLQRLSALAMAPFVLVHLGVILVAVRGGLTTAEILSRTQGSWGCACHAARPTHGPLCWRPSC